MKQMTSACVVLLVGLVGACSSSSSGSGSGAKTCCSSMDDSGVSTCVCQPEGMYSQGGLSSTLTVSGSSCSVSTTYNGSTSNLSGSVVPSCGDGG
jgi:hypothetical protein